LLADPDLTDLEKQALLTDWARDLDRELDSAAEGFGGPELLTTHQEGRLANEAQTVQTVQTALTDAGKAGGA
jgi:hypothetical protein